MAYTLLSPPPFPTATLLSRPQPRILDLASGRPLIWRGRPLRPIRGAAIWDDIWAAVSGIWGFFSNAGQGLVNWFRARADAVFGWLAERFWQGVYWLNDRLKEFTGFANPLIDNVRLALERMWRNVVTWVVGGLSNLVFYARATWEGLATRAGTYVTGLGEWMGGGLILLRDYLAQRVGDLLGSLSGLGADVSSWLGGAVTTLRSWMGGAFTQLQGWMGGALSGVQTYLGERAADLLRLDREMRAWMDSILGGLPGAFRGGLPGFLVWAAVTIPQGAQSLRERLDWGIDWLGDRLEDAKQWFSTEIIDPWTDHLRSFLATIGGAIGGVVNNIWGALASGWSAFSSFFQRSIIEPIGRGLQWLVDGLGQALSGFIQSYLPITGGQEGVLPVTPVPPPALQFAHVTQFMAPFLAMSIGGELIHPLKNLGLGRLSAILWDASNFATITSSYILPYAEAAIRRPLARVWNELFRSTLPTMGELGMMFAKHEILPEVFDAAMAQQGLDDYWLGVYRRYIYRDPRLGELVRIAQVSYPPETVDPVAWAWLTERGLAPANPRHWWWSYKLAKAGYEPVDVRALPVVGELASVRREQTLWLDQIERNFREGWMTDVEARALMREARMVGYAIDFRMQGAYLERRYEIRDLLFKAAQHRYVKGLASRDETGAAMAGLGMDAERIRLTLDYFDALRARRNESVESESVFAPLVREAVASRREDLIADGAFRAYLSQAGVAVEALDDYSDTMALAIRREEAEMVRRASDAAYAKGRLTEAQYARALTETGYSRRRAELYSDIIEGRRPVVKLKPRYETEEGELRAKAVIDLWWADVLSNAQLLAALQDLGMPPSLAQARLQALQAQRRRRPPRVPPTVPPYYQTAEGRLRVNTAREDYRDGRTTHEALIERLVELGIPRSLATAMADYERAREAPPEE